MKKILVTRRLLSENSKRISSIFDVRLNNDDKLLSPEEILKYAKDCNGILTFPDTILSKDLILKLPESVKIISNYAVGFGNIDLMLQLIKESSLQIHLMF